MTDSTLTAPELFKVVQMIDRHGIDQLLIALSEICGSVGEHVEQRDERRAHQWFTLEGAIGTAVTKATGL